MRCLVTAGPTYEPLDQVRRLTNFSSGRLGSELANALAAHGHSVTLLLGQQATFRTELRVQRVQPFGTTADLEKRLRALAAGEIQAVFHAAAVSDFGFGKVWLRSETGQLTEVRSGKFSSRRGMLLAELVPTTKIISRLRDWFPAARLVGWKYEVEGARSAALQSARQQIAECRVDACIANGPAYGAGFGLVTAPDGHVHLKDASALFESLNRLID